MGFFADRETGKRRSRVVRLLPAAAVILAVALIAGGTIVRDFRQERAQAAARLESVAELRATQVQAWLDRHMSFAQFLDDSTVMADALHALAGPRRRRGRQAAAGARDRLAPRRRRRQRADRRRPGQGARARASGRSRRRARAAGRPCARRSRPARPPAPPSTAGPAPRSRSGWTSSSRCSRPARRRAARSCCASTRAARCSRCWPTGRCPAARPRRCCGIAWTTASSTSATCTAARQPRAHQRGRRDVDAADRARRARRAAARRRRAGGRLAGAPRCCGVARPVAGTDWWLVAKMDMDEVDAPAWQRARETGLAALLALLGAALGRAPVGAAPAGARGRARAARAARAPARAGAAGGDRAQRQRRHLREGSRGPLRVLQPRGGGDHRPLASTQVLGRTNAELFEPATAARLDRGRRARARPASCRRNYEEVVPARERPGAHAVHQGAAGRRRRQRAGHAGRVARRDRDARRPARAARRARSTTARWCRCSARASSCSIAQGAIVSSNPAAERLLGDVDHAGMAGRRTSTPGLAAAARRRHADAGDETPTARVLAGEGAAARRARPCARRRGPDDRCSRSARCRWSTPTAAR